MRRKNWNQYKNSMVSTAELLEAENMWIRIFQEHYYCSATRRQDNSVFLDGIDK